VTRHKLSSTITHVGDNEAPGAADLGDLLYLALECERPLARSARYALRSVDEVVIGRADERTTTRVVDQGTRRLLVGVPDAWMSGVHVRLVRMLGTWMAEDASSKNGTFVNGAPMTRSALADGDVLEAGHTLFVFRERQSVKEVVSNEIESSRLPVPAPGLRTLVPDLAERFSRLSQIANSSVSVVVHGETGTGKELVARAVHQLSGRPGPFIALNCGALSESLVPSELFGHKKGAFSGATEDRPGFFRSAHRGTLFLDEIGDLALALQPVLLRVLQEREVVPVGASQPVSIDIRLVAATHRDLEKLVEPGAFREDLLARLAGFTVHLPPLRARREEIGLIAADLLERLHPERAHDVRFALDAARSLFLYEWPLNIRELEKSLDAAVVLAGADPIRLTHLPDPLRRAARSNPPPKLDLPESAHDEPDEGAPARPLTEAELRHKEEISALLRECGGNVSAVARTLGKARMQVQRWLKRYQLDPASFRD
jgi:sigma-54 dependent transcriptional regulator, acetoin dehydrogenase operon transcriptional activator AcoR